MRGGRKPGWDDLDIRLIDILQQDADQTLRELGDQVGLTPSAVQRRITRYKRGGLLRTVAVLDPDRTRQVVRAIVLVTLVTETLEHHRKFKAELRARAEVQQCYAVAGRWEYVVILVASSVTACRELGDVLFKADDNIQRYEKLMVFDAAKIGTATPATLLRANDM